MNNTNVLTDEERQKFILYLEEFIVKQNEVIESCEKHDFNNDIIKLWRAVNTAYKVVLKDLVEKRQV